jgi:hypothetical protein
LATCRTFMPACMSQQRHTPHAVYLPKSIMCCAALETQCGGLQAEQPCEGQHWDC